MSISCEEENSLRLCMLVDISRRAVKTYFDEQFHPDILKQTIKKAENKLIHLKKTNVLSETQWEILQGKNTTKIFLRSYIF